MGRKRPERDRLAEISPVVDAAARKPVILFVPIGKAHAHAAHEAADVDLAFADDEMGVVIQNAIGKELQAEFVPVLQRLLQIAALIGGIAEDGLPPAPCTTT